MTLIAAVGSLAGYALASNKALATLPSTMAVIGTALSTIPASLLMKRVGRRVGFVVGAVCAMAGGLISVAAMARGQTTGSRGAGPPGLSGAPDDGQTRAAHAQGGARRRDLG